MVELLETIIAIAFATCIVLKMCLCYVCRVIIIIIALARIHVHYYCSCISLPTRPEDLYQPGEVDFDPNEERLLAKLHLATSGSNTPGVDQIIMKLMLEK